MHEAHHVRVCPRFFRAALRTKFVHRYAISAAQFNSTIGMYLLKKILSSQLLYESEHFLSNIADSGSKSHFLQRFIFLFLMEFL